MWSKWDTVEAISKVNAYEVDGAKGSIGMVDAV
jgi:hypothetical protein